MSSSSSTTLSANLNVYGSPVTYYFEYGTTSAYGSSTSAEYASGEGMTTATVGTTGLMANIEYHFRVVATNISGETVAGADDVFRTLPASIHGLPDNRAYEMVTPVNKEDAEVYVPYSKKESIFAEGNLTFGMFLAAVNGSAVVYQADPTSHGAAGESSGEGLGSPYMAERLPQGGWTQLGISPPGRRRIEYKGFSSDLATGILAARAGRS